MAATWMTVWAPHTANLVFAKTFKGEVKDPQNLDFETKITEFDDKSEDEIKVLCSSTRPDPYHFTIVIDTIKCSFSIVDYYESLQGLIFDDIVKILEEEIIEKKWHTKKGEALKAKPLAKKLRNIVGAMDVAAAMQGCLIGRTWRFGCPFRMRTDGHTCLSILFRQTFACKKNFTNFFSTY